MRVPGPISLCIIACVALAACASEPYREPIAAFAQAVNKSGDALATLDSQLTGAHAAVQRSRALSGRYFLKLDKCDHNTENYGKCVLLLQKTTDDGSSIGEPSKMQPDAKLSQVRALFGDIASYASSLSAVSNANTDHEIENAVTKALASVEKLAKDESVREKLDKQDASVRDFATPIATIINWVVGRYVETVKINAMREATRAADPIVRAATLVLIDIEGQGKRVLYTKLVDNLSARMDAWREEPNEANLDKLLAAVEAVQRFSIETRSSLFVALGRAHKGLADRFADSAKAGWVTTMAEVEQFNNEAQALLGVIDSLTVLTQSE